MKKHSKLYLSGISMMVKASFAFSFMAFFVKLACRTVPSWEVVFFRSLIGLVMVSALIRLKKDSFWGKARWALTARGVTGFGALILYFYTIARLPLGTAVLLNYTSPIFAVILAVFVLHEKPGWFLFGMVLVAFTGVALLLGPAVGTDTAAGLIGLISAVFAAMAYITIRSIKQHESPLTVIFYFTGISTVGALFFLPFGFRIPTPLEWFYLLAIGVGSSYGQLWLTISLRRAPAALIMPFTYVTPLLSFVYGYFFWGETLSGRAVTGAAFIVLSGSAVSCFKTRRKIPAPVAP